MFNLSPWSCGDGDIFGVQRWFRHRNSVFPQTLDVESDGFRDQLPRLREIWRYRETTGEVRNSHPHACWPLFKNHGIFQDFTPVCFIIALSVPIGTSSPN